MAPVSDLRKTRSAGARTTRRPGALETDLFKVYLPVLGGQGYFFFFFVGGGGVPFRDSILLGV